MGDVASRENRVATKIVEKVFCACHVTELGINWTPNTEVFDSVRAVAGEEHSAGRSSQLLDLPAALRPIIIGGLYAHL